MKIRKAFVVLLLLSFPVLTGCDMADLQMIGEIFKGIGEGAGRLASLFEKGENAAQDGNETAKDIEKQVSAPTKPKTEKDPKSVTGQVPEGLPGMGGKAGKAGDIEKPGTGKQAVELEENIRRGLKQIDFNLSDIDRLLQKKIGGKPESEFGEIRADLDSIRKELEGMRKERVTDAKAKGMADRFARLKDRFKQLVLRARTVAKTVDYAKSGLQELVAKIKRWQDLLTGGGATPNGGDGTIPADVRRSVKSAWDAVKFGTSFPYTVANRRVGCADVVSYCLAKAGIIPGRIHDTWTLRDTLKTKGYKTIKAPPFQEGDVIFWRTYDWNKDGRVDEGDNDTHVGIILKNGNSTQAMNNSSDLKKPVLNDPLRVAPVTTVLRKS